MGTSVPKLEKTSSAQSLRLSLVNCQSLLPHFDEFKDHFVLSSFDVICMTETWLKPVVPDDMVNLTGYNLIRHDRTGKRGGGVGAFIQQSLHYSVLATSPSEYCFTTEFIIIEISGIKMSKLLLAIVYKPPKITSITDFESTFLRFYPTYKNIIIVGDFNVNMMNPESYDCLHLNNFFHCNNLYLVSTQPTHHTLNSHTCLDLCVVDDMEKLSHFSQSPVPFLSAHDQISVSYNFTFPFAKLPTFVFRDFRNFSLEKFLEDLLSADWLCMTQSNCIDDKLKIFNDYLVSYFNRHAPVRICHPKRPTAPWLTSGIRKNMCERNRIRRAFIRSKQPALHAVYKRLRAEVKLLINESKRKYFSSALSGLEEPKRIWKELRQLGIVRKKENYLAPNLTVEELNNYFTCLANTDQDNYSPHSPVPNFLDPSVPFSDKNFYFQSITPEMLNKFIFRSKSNSTGVDEISYTMINKSYEAIMPIILDLFNHSLQSCKFPTLWKSSLVTPIKKVKNPSNPSDYRPISILCTLSKALERIVHFQVVEFLSLENSFDPFQSGFRNNFSTQSALIKITDDLRYAIDKKLITVLVLFDFSKAFDRVNHTILLDKLKKLNFSCSVLNWFHSYLVNRYQAVRDSRGNLSTWATVTTGVPQGSVLGPLLFSLYILDLPNCLKHTNYMLYADDLQIYRSCSPHEIDEAVSKINEDINRITEWATRHDFILNTTKTKAIIIGSHRMIRNVNLTTTTNIVVNGVSIPYSSNVHNLGITLTANLSWDCHVNNISNKIHSILYQLKVHKYLLPFNTRKTLISSLIFSVIDYCCLVYNDLNEESNLKLHRALNSCVRFIFDLRRDVHITPYYKQLRWLNVKYRREYLLGSFLFVLFKNKSPRYLYDLFHSCPSVSAMYTRSDPNMLYFPRHRTTVYSKSFLVTACRIWNEIPSDIKTYTSVKTFKIKYYDYLLSR